MHDTLAGRSRVQYEEQPVKTSLVGAFHPYNGVDTCSPWLMGNQSVVIPNNDQQQHPSITRQHDIPTTAINSG